MEFSTSSNLSFFFLLLCVSIILLLSEGQQSYVNNKQLDCYNNYSVTDGFLCNGPQRCNSYLAFRSTPLYDSPAIIAYLLGSEASAIAQINNISDVNKIPTDTQILVPVNCSCSATFYQHNTSYTLKDASETYFTVANNTFQGLTTCQALMHQNPYDSRNLSVDSQLLVPLRCACPSRNQTANGVRFLLTDLVDWGDSISSIAQTFGVDEQSIYDANGLSWNSLIYPFTPLLVPLKTEPTKIPTTQSPAPSISPPVEPSIVPESNKSSKKWVFIAVGIGAALILLALSGFLIWFFRLRSQRGKPLPPQGKRLPESVNYTAAASENYSGSVSSQGLRNVVESLTLYKFEELQKATGFFSEAHRIKGSVYHGAIKGDTAAIKRMRGDVSNEITILKQISHSHVIRLSGFCVHEGNTYLVYEFAENGSLSECLHEKSYRNSSCLGWKQRIQIAYDVADGLNYLHNYTNPPYIHKDLKSTNILLDRNFRAKIANFGLARTVENQDEGGLQLTRHVVGTQGYMAPEYLENGVVTPKLDVFTFGVVILELLSGREAASGDEKKGELLLSASIEQVLEGENVREKLRGFIDPSLRHEYPLDLAFSMAQLAKNCVAHDLNSRPTMAEVFMSLSKILSSSLDWDPSDELEHSRSLGHGR
ncbi:hypothetical protein HHK36_008871 [Tetracentron sinense]|uniref:Uncharacterized protein n=1 Tax=Tetracentron sinense TaxID=13715 RepID=A0A834ZG81_TETSI|nr:hypothetical protein HHK36_008871 [Tetracentron sinense]